MKVSMKEKWNKTENKKIADGQPVPQSITYMSDHMYQPKLLLKSPSLRAIRNYNNLSIRDSTNYDNLTFIPENESDPAKYEEPYTISSVSSYGNPPGGGDGGNSLMLNTYDIYDYANTIRSSSGRTSTGSELGSEKADMGSTVKLVQTKVERSLKTWCARLDTVLCTVALAANFGNLYRLPQVALTHGGLPFVVAYVILVILIGLPMIFLELGIGQLAQEGFIKSWRAVPFFRGVGYIKLLAGCLLCIYYPLYMGLSYFYVIWLAKEQTVPFSECSVVKRTEEGYAANGIDSHRCLQKTFLQAPSDDTYWYGIYASLLFNIWVIVIILSIRRTKSFIRSLTILLFPTIACYIALTVKAVTMDTEPGYLSSENFWEQFGKADVWYYAAIQVFFSTYAGFGTFVTNAGIIYNRVNPLWTALSYVVVNTILGVGSVLLCNTLSGENGPTEDKKMSELYIIRLIYDISIKDGSQNQVWYWTLVAYLGILLSGFISMATFTYTLLKAITIESRRRIKWWQSSIVLSFLGFIIGCAALLQPNFKIVRLLDHYIVGNLILITVVVEILALLAFYGTERIKSDFEFMLGHILSKIWIILWWIAPIILIGVFSWGLATLPLEGTITDDPDWLYGTGWAVILLSIVYILVIGIRTVISQDEYTFCDKLKSSLKPSSKWGPKDPIMRHNWIQWNSKAQQGERDFTLKRRGTREYTRSVKKNTKKLHIQAESELSTSTVPGEYHKRDDILCNDMHFSNGTSTYAEPYYMQNNATLIRVNENGTYNRPLQVTSLPSSKVNGLDYRKNLNPLARPNTYNGSINLENNSDDYGTFYKGPFIIGDKNINHICHRRYSQENEMATEL